ncbi:hypothetical protein LAZ67_7002154 [Cordylochernes scorpioides]|uniref:Mos1 transposase HTH domain-containing protein n=1 Tax=Cordylochernes scorpioides TaxID=51811 RepID=A0ABY6KR34_9ARAC|nr:hypothetical protein LAZ67_7002154 [Cordylochernes scorpioides]
MELPHSSPAKCELRSVIRFLNAKNNSPVEIHRQLVEVYGEKCMDTKNVQKWCREFNEGRINVHDEQRSGRPSFPESTVARIDEMVHTNRRITLEEIEDGLNEDCSHFSVHKIVSETLGYRKVSARMGGSNSQLQALTEKYEELLFENKSLKCNMKVLKVKMEHQAAQFRSSLEEEIQVNQDLRHQLAKSYQNFNKLQNQIRDRNFQICCLTHHESRNVFKNLKRIPPPGHLEEWEDTSDNLSSSYVGSPNSSSQSDQLLRRHACCLDTTPSNSSLESEFSHPKYPICDMV